MWKYVSLQRERKGLLEATRQLHNVRASVLSNGSTHQNNVIEWRETVNMLKVAELVIAAALQRRESRGSHSRLDYPDLEDMLAGRHFTFQPVFDETSKGASSGGRKGMPLLDNVRNGDLTMYSVEDREEMIFNG
jgi:succinate dehydrogenase/fumarate reductase flavoprotein subunit